MSERERNNPKGSIKKPEVVEFLPAEGRRLTEKAGGEGGKGATQSGGWDILDFVALLAVQQVAGFFAVSIGRIFMEKSGSSLDLFSIGRLLGLESFWFESYQKYIEYFPAILGTIAANAILILFFAIRWRQQRGEREFRLPKFKALVLWVAGVFLALLAFNLLYQWVLKFFGITEIKQKVALFFKGDAPLIFSAFGFLLVVFFAPLGEELLYRGVLFPSLKRYLSIHWAALVSGVVFAALHFEPITLIPLAFMGYLLALARARTGSMWTPILIHAANNLAAFLSIVLSK